MLGQSKFACCRTARAANSSEASQPSISVSSTSPPETIAPYSSTVGTTPRRSRLSARRSWVAEISAVSGEQKSWARLPDVESSSSIAAVTEIEIVRLICSLLFSKPGCSPGLDQADLVDLQTRPAERHAPGPDVVEDRVDVPLPL